MNERYWYYMEESPQKPSFYFLSNIYGLWGKGAMLDGKQIYALAHNSSMQPVVFFSPVQHWYSFSVPKEISVWELK